MNQVDNQVDELLKLIDASVNISIDFTAEDLDFFLKNIILILN